MSLRIERAFGTHSVGSSDDIPFWKTCAVRIENIVSKYFLEFAEACLPRNIYEGWVWAVQSIYWSVKDWFFPCWMKQFKSSVGLVIQEPVFKFDLAKLERFQNSAKLSELVKKFPFACLWTEEAGWFMPARGTCYGESLALMKYRDDCAIPSGFDRGETLSVEDLGNEVLFLQAMGFLDRYLKGIVKAKEQMKSHGIVTRDIASKESSMQQAWLFHYLRKSEIPRLRARYLSEHCQDLLLQPLSALQNIRDSISEGIEEMVGEPLDFNAYASEEDYSERTQSELDEDVCDFLLQDSGVFTLIGSGKNRVGHAMFLKIEDGQCMTYDSSTKECFTMPHTHDGIYKTLELMKKVLETPNFGGKTHYQVIALRA